MMDALRPIAIGGHFLFEVCHSCEVQSLKSLDRPQDPSQVVFLEQIDVELDRSKVQKLRTPRRLQYYWMYRIWLFRMLAFP